MSWRESLHIIAKATSSVIPGFDPEPRRPAKFLLLLLLALSILFAHLSAAQTIHKKDLPMFLGRAVPADTIIGNDTIKILKFDKWKIDSLDSRGERIAFHDSSLVGNNWYLPDTDDHITAWEKDSRRYRFPNNDFYIMEDVHGYGGGSSILSVWRPYARDSLSYICGMNGPFGGYMSIADIKWMGQFPDGSILMYIHNSGGDECDWWGGDTFLRGEDICNFRPFYSNGWSGQHGQENQYYLKFISGPAYQVLETSNYFSPDTLYPSEDCQFFKLDSATSRVLNLWQMAKDSFEIDTGAK